MKPLYFDPDGGRVDILRRLLAAPERVSWWARFRAWLVATTFPTTLGTDRD